MKSKLLFLLVLPAFLTAFVSLTAVTVRAVDVNDDTYDMAGIIDGLRESIPDDVLPLLPDTLFDDSATAADTADVLGIDYIFGALMNILREAVTPAAGFLSTILGTVLISSALKLFSGDVSDGRLSDSTSVITCLSLSVYTVTVMENLVMRVDTFAGSISTFSTAMVPMMSAMLSASGNITGAAVTTSGLLLFSAALQYAITYVFIPIFRLGLALSVVTAVVGGDSGAAGISGAVKRTFTWLAAGAATIFAAVLSYQTQLAAAADSAAARGLRYTVSSTIPVVGGAIGDAVRTAASGLAVIKSGAGAVGIVVLILLTCPLLITLFLTSAALGIGASVSSILGCGRESALLTEMRSATGFAIAIVSLSTVVFIFALALFMKTAPAMGT